MKIKQHRVALLLSLFLTAPLVGISHAQDAETAPQSGNVGPAQTEMSEAPEKGPREGKPRRERAGRMLTKEERQKLMAAQEKISSDPEVQAKREEAKEAMKELADTTRAKLLAADPTLEPILDKIKDSRPMAGRMGDPLLDGFRGGGKDGPKGERPKRDEAAKLTPEERKTLKEARETAQKDPAVTAAKEKLAATQEPEQKKEARQALRNALHEAMTKANPETAAILSKMDAEKQGEGAAN